jgi:2-succinyl-6-hydroxy-2,4-cyclohexadiene-1-carboxylate synthase
MASPLVLLHGFTHTGWSWDGVVAALGERYRPLAPDIRGHGSASMKRPITLAKVIEDLDSLEPTRFALLGYSMGGRIALHYAITRPQRVKRLVLIGASPGIADPPLREARRRADEQLAAQIARQSIEEFATGWATTPALAGQPDEVARRAHADRLNNTPAGLSEALKGLGTGALPPLWHRLPELGMPVSLVVGQRDEKFLAIAKDMARAIPDVELHFVAGAGHAVHLERPQAIAEVLSR